jgi:hypothetical protein
MILAGQDGLINLPNRTLLRARLNERHCSDAAGRLDASLPLPRPRVGGRCDLALVSGCRSQRPENRRSGFEEQ